MAEISKPVSGRPYALITATPGESLRALNEAEIITLYKAHGALLFRGFDGVNLSCFSGFANSFCATSMFNESPNRTLLDAESNIQSVDLGTDAFPLHPELSREPWKPDVCFFACMAPPGEGGETTICDGVSLVHALSPDVRAGFAARRLLYVSAATAPMLDFWIGTSRPSRTQLAAPPAGCPYSFFVHGQQVVRAFTRPALHTPMFIDEPAFGNFLLFARYFLNKPNFPAFANGEPVPNAWTEDAKRAGDAHTTAVTWQRGDVLMLDNTRFLHGRNPIRDAAGRQIASYFGYLKFALPNPEEPADPPWRRIDFRPPQATAVSRVSAR